MGLIDGYGVIIGTKADYFRDDPDNFGRYYHGNLIVRAPLGDYRCAIDVDPQGMPDGIQWRVVRIDPANFAAIKALPNGWHAIASNPSSGAIDYLRSTMLQPPRWFQYVNYGGMVTFIVRLTRLAPRWNNGTGIQALAELEKVLNKGVRFYVFGEPFRVGLGVHNVHMNQGDPPGRHAAENAIWQDGITIAEKSTGEFFAFLNKFKTQSLKTDDMGHPVP